MSEVHQGGFVISVHGRIVERAVIPVPVLLELVEPERRLGDRGEHRSVAGRVIGHERFAASAPLQLVLLAGTNPLIARGIDGQRTRTRPPASARNTTRLPSSAAWA